MSRLLVLLSALLLSLPVMAQEMVATIRPLALIAQEITGKPVDHIIPTGISLHDYHARPADHAKVASAQLVLWLGPEFEPHFKRQIARNKKGIVMDASRVANVTLLKSRMTDGRDGSNTDMHFWLDARNAIAVAHALSQTLAKQDPSNAKLYAARAAAFANKLKGLSNAQPATKTSKPYVATHDAYRYLESVGNMRFMGAMSAGHHSHSNPKRVAKLATDIRDNKIGCLLAEPNFNKSHASAIFQKNSYKVAEIDEMFAKSKTFSEGYGVILKQVNQCLAGS